MIAYIIIVILILLYAGHMYYMYTSTVSKKDLEYSLKTTEFVAAKCRVKQDQQGPIVSAFQQLLQDPGYAEFRLKYNPPLV